MYGGHDGALSNSDMWSWDGHSWQLHPQDVPKPSTRTFPTGAFDDKKQSFIMAGGVATGLDYRKDVWAWDGKAWTQLADMDVGRGNHLMAYDPTGDVMLAPGGNVGGVLNKQTSVRKNDFWYVPSAAFPSFRAGYALVYDPFRKALMLDGGDETFGANTPQGAPLYWNVVSEVWEAAPSGGFNGKRCSHSLVWDRDRNVVLMIGGLPSLDGNTLDPEYFKMHEWDGTSWKTIEAQNPATKRGWDGSKWPPINASNGVRREMIVVYDQARKRVVLFGGADTKYTTSFDDTWEYDPAVQGWAEVNVVPKALNDRPIAAYDEARKRSVVLTNKARETWLWDGTSWAHALPRTTEHPEAEGSAAAYDAVRKQVVTFGGSVNGVASDETWLWDGGDWKKAEGLAPPPGPTT